MQIFELRSRSATACSLISGLTVLDAAPADIPSLGGIHNLTYPTGLALDNNLISDLRALSGPVELTDFLLDNTGLGTGDEVGLNSTILTCVDVVAMEARGVTVVSDC